LKLSFNGGEKMLNKNPLIIIGVLIAFCGSSWATSSSSQPPLYPNTLFKEEMTEAPWVVPVNQPIPFLFMVKDGNATNPLNELHCLAIYDISDGVRHYANGERFTPLPNNDFWGNLQCPPLAPDPYNPNVVPNQVYYHDFCDQGHPEFGENFRYWIVDKFENPGSRWQGLAGFPITPYYLGYQPGDVITFRLVLLGEEGVAELNNDVHHLKDVRVKVVEALIPPVSTPLPKLPDRYLVDTHYHRLI